MVESVGSKETIRVQHNVREATLVENFIDTVKATGFCYIRAKITGVSSKDKGVLVLVTPGFFTYPLKKDDKVLVMIPQDSPHTPVLFSVKSTVDVSALIEDTLPSIFGSQGNSPFAYDTALLPSSSDRQPTKVLSVSYLSEDFFTLFCGTYTIVQSGTVRVVTGPGAINVSAPDGTTLKTDKVLIDTGNVKTSSDDLDLSFQRLKMVGLGAADLNFKGYKLVSNEIELKAILSDMANFLTDLYTRLGAAEAVIAASGLPVPVPVVFGGAASKIAEVAATITKLNTFSPE